MIDISKGRYWDKPWSLVDGCTPCSPGCYHCWSAAMTHRFNQYPANPLGELSGCLTDGNGHFNGHIKTHPERLHIPLTRKKPTVYAVWNDLFHEDVPEIFIMESLAVTVRSPHIFLILTKRAQRMAEFFKGEDFTGLLENIYFGLTVCNQQEVNEKIPIFLQVPGKKFLSIEPMLGPIDLTECFTEPASFALRHLSRYYNTPDGMFDPDGKGHQYTRKIKTPIPIDAVILGGETGPRARPMHPDWVRSVRDQCATAGVPFFLKYMNKTDGRVLDGKTYDELPWRS